MDKKIPEKVINRLTLYHCILSDFINNKTEFISSKQIAQLLNIDDSQVRKDINYLDNSGKSRVGYIVKELKIAIEKTLGFKKNKKAFIIGAGNLGTAIANYGNFTDYGLNIISLFDNDPQKIGKIINGMEIKNISELPTELLDDIMHFFEVYKQLEKKQTSVDKMLGRDEAEAIVEKCINNYKEKFER